MTLEQETQILTMYKADKSYKEISYATGIPMGTISAFLSRKHKQLKQLKTIQRRQELAKYTSHFMKTYGLEEPRAQALYEIMKLRFDTKKQNALRQGRVFTVRFSELAFPEFCPILGIKLDYWGENCRADDYPTFDRIDNRQDYVTGNVLVVSWRANRIKNDGTADEHRLIAEFLDKTVAEDG